MKKKNQWQSDSFNRKKCWIPLLVIRGMFRSSSQLKICCCLSRQHTDSFSKFTLGAFMINSLIICLLFGLLEDGWHWLLTMKKKQSVVAIINWRFSFVLCTSFRSDDPFALLAKRHGKSSFCAMKKKLKNNQFNLRDFFVFFFLTEISITIIFEWKSLF